MEKSRRASLHLSNKVKGTTASQSTFKEEFDDAAMGLVAVSGVATVYVYMFVSISHVWTAPWPVTLVALGLSWLLIMLFFTGLIDLSMAARCFLRNLASQLERWSLGIEPKSNTACQFERKNSTKGD